MQRNRFLPAALVTAAAAYFTHYFRLFNLAVSFYNEGDHHRAFHAIFTSQSRVAEVMINEFQHFFVGAGFAFRFGQVFATGEIRHFFYYFEKFSVANV